MGLGESQRLLARLSTDADLRSRFADDPAGVAAGFGLSPTEALALPFGQVEEFARSLVSKRRGEVESLLPLTCRALGSAKFADLFFRHARGYVPAGIKKHRDDAVAFAKFLAGSEVALAWVIDLARFEAAALLAHDPARRCVLARLRHHPADLARSATGEGRPPAGRPTLVAWSRWTRGGRLRLIVLSWPPWARRGPTSPSSPGRL